MRQKIMGIIVAPLLILGFTIAWWVSSQLGGWLSYLLSEERVEQAMAVGMRSVSIITVLSALAGLGIGSFLTWLLTRPILDMTFVARRVKDGDLSVRAPVWANDEIGELGRAFNDMIASLDTSYKELERSNHQLKHRNRELAVLYHLADVANKPFSMQEVSALGLQQTLEYTEASAGLILLLNGHGPTISASQNLPPAFLDAAVKYLPKMDLKCIGDVSQGALLFFEDINNPSYLSPPLAIESQKLQYKTLVIAPILVKKSLLGILAVVYVDHVHLDRQQHQLISAICNQLGVTIQNNQLWEELRHKEQLRAQLLNKVVSAQEDERHRISRELHDETGQALTSLLVQLKILEHYDNLDDVKKQVAAIRHLTLQTLQEVRRLAADLRPAALDDLGLISALEGYIDDYASKSGLVVKFHYENMEEIRLPHDIEIVLYRVIQESLTNILRHAQAKSVRVTLDREILAREREVIHVAVVDDGCGFDTGFVLDGRDRGLGLLGMQERIELLGGRLEILSEVGQGTRVDVKLALPD
ncbi:MAG: histidine kinase [Chloroflexota bacterium]